MMLLLKVAFLTVFFVLGVKSQEFSGCWDKGCSHECAEKAGLPTCSCPANMALGPDKKTCQDRVPILLGMFRGISMFTPGPGDMRLVIPGKTTAFDFHYNRKEIFAFINNTIYSQSVDDNTKKPIAVLKTDTTVTSLAVDWVHDDLYWICQQKSAVEAASMNGTNHQEVVKHNSSGTPSWNNIVVDPYTRKLFWLGLVHVFTSDLTGTNLKSRLPSSSADFRPEDIALDIRAQLVYVIGSKVRRDDKVVIRSKYDGSQSQEVLNIGQQGSLIFGFGVLGNVVYWESNEDGETLYKSEIPKTGVTPNITLVEELYQVVYDMKIYHPDVQKPLK